MIPPLAALLVALGGAPASSASPAADRVAIVVGSAIGARGGVPLRYAGREAREMGRVLATLGETGEVHELIDPGAGAIDATFDQVVASRAGRPPISMFHFYYSGHANPRGLELGATVYPWDRLRSRLKALPAQVFVAVIDACQSGEILRPKGSGAVPVSIDVLPSERSPRGGIFITATGTGEQAQESDTLSGSVFSHYLLSALRGAGDASGDGRVSVDEAYGFAYRHTLARTTGSQLGPQHPSFDVDLAGHGALILTWIVPKDAVLVLDGGAPPGRYAVLDHEGVSVELWKAAAQVLRVALPAGVWEVHHSGPDGRRVARVELAARREQTLDVHALVAEPDEHGRAKAEAPANLLSASYLASSAFVSAGGLHSAGVLRYGRRFPAVEAGPLLRVGGTRFFRDGVRVALWDAGVGGFALWRFAVSERVSLGAGAETCLLLVHEAASALGASDASHAWAFAGGALGAISIALDGPWSLEGRADVGMLVLNEAGERRARFTAGAEGGIGLAF